MCKWSRNEKRVKGVLITARASRKKVNTYGGLLFFSSFFHQSGGVKFATFTRASDLWNSESVLDDDNDKRVMEKQKKKKKRRKMQATYVCCRGLCVQDRVFLSGSLHRRGGTGYTHTSGWGVLYILALSEREH